VLITLSGLPGSGTSTVARAAASQLGLAHVDGGTVFRTMASEHGLSLAEFARVAEADDSIDRALDDRLLARAREGEVLLESRLAGWLATRGAVPALRAWIHCDDEERARRVGARDGQELADALAHNAEREASERLRYLGYYDIDLRDLSIYDLVLDSTATPAEQIVERLVGAATARFG
jgi:predicted cytidylate kinase